MNSFYNGLVENMSFKKQLLMKETIFSTCSAIFRDGIGKTFQSDTS